MYNNADTVNVAIAKHFGTQPLAPVAKILPIEEKIFIDSDAATKCIEEMETDLSLMKGMLKHLTSLKRTREEQTYQMKLIREIGFNIFDNTSTLEKEVMSILK